MNPLSTEGSKEVPLESLTLEQLSYIGKQLEQEIASKNSKRILDSSQHSFDNLSKSL